MNAVSVGRRARQHSQLGIHDSGFTQTLLVYVNTCGRRVRDGIQDHGDFWWTFQDTPDAFLHASRPAPEDANGERHAVTLPHSVPRRELRFLSVG